MNYWSLAGLRLRTPTLELRWPTPADLGALAELAADGVHEPDRQPFMVPWAQTPPAERAKSTLQFHWRQWAAWQPSDWSLGMVVLRDGVVVGTQGMEGRNFAISREVSTGSWVGLRHHGQGIGTEMRAAVLHLAFEGLGAEHATSGAFADNAASLAVSRKLGYADDGIDRQVVGGEVVVTRRFRLSREQWQEHRRIPVEIVGLEACAADFGLPQSDLSHS
ncbi:MAG: GNAT family N-acetyltransferase [Actinomycetota bacterium]|nr:GNAT family N-acetyltransferase [Actinomycetota bacterium]